MLVDAVAVFVPSEALIVQVSFDAQLPVIVSLPLLSATAPTPLLIEALVIVLL